MPANSSRKAVWIKTLSLKLQRQERDKPQNFNSSDKALMEEIRKNTVTRAMLSPTDYIVVLAYTDGTYAKTYVRADKMPESAKAGIAKNAPADSYYQ